MSDGDHGYVLFYQLIGLAIDGQTSRRIGQRGAAAEGIPDVGEAIAKLLAGAFTEVEVEEVGGVGIVCAPTEHVEAVDLASVRGIEEGA